MITQTLTLLTYSSSFLILLSILETCNASCIPSSCGEVRNISAPFRLSSDPANCGDPAAELVCENNLTTLYRNSHKYYLRSIDYQDFSVIATDSVVRDASSFCTFFSPSGYSDPYYYRWGLNRPVYFISCVDPLPNSSAFIRVPDCDKEGKHTYVKAGWIRVREVAYTCTIDVKLQTYWDFGEPLEDIFQGLSNVSVSEIRESVVYGFKLYWFQFMCGNCRYNCDVERTDGLIICIDPSSFLSYKWAHLMDSFRRPPKGVGTVAICLMIFILVAGVVFAGVGIAAKIIVGLGGFYLVLVKDWNRRNTQFTIEVTFGLKFGIGFLCAMGFLIYKFRRRRMSAYDDIEDFLQSDKKLAPIRYSYSDLKKMTRGFREKLGEGGFATVYKGKLRSGHNVAIKLLGKGKSKGSAAKGQDFISEIESVGRIHHVNVVKLVGYCEERSKRALVFDFMPNGSLDKYIFKQENAQSLNWDKKFKIAVGVARGIEYLHRGCDVQILHFDIKPHNILLDDAFIPKVSDFGLAKLFSVEKENVTLTRALRGTVGYVAPELINRSIGAISYKADVYSFSMLLMEMLGLNREFRGTMDDSTKYFPQWIHESVNQGKDIEIEKANESNSDDENDSTKRLVRKMTIVALWCIQKHPEDRPPMNRVVQMLEDDLEHLQIPEYQSRSSHIQVNEEESWDSGATDSASLLHYNNASSFEISIA